jgi:excisionase family DNA binding protein
MTDLHPLRNRPLLRIDEAAEVFAVKPKTIREWIRNGYLPAIQIARTTRIPEDAIEQLLFRASSSRPGGDYR